MRSGLLGRAGVWRVALLAAGSTAFGETPPPLPGWAVGAPAGGYATILRTTNGGADWVRQGNPAALAGVWLAGAAAVDAETAWAVGGVPDGSAAIYHTTNGGADWICQKQWAPTSGEELMKIQACSRDVAWVSGTPGLVLRTTDGGRTWEDRSPPGATTPLQGITALDEDMSWAAGHEQGGFASIYHTTNGGLTWVRQTNGVGRIANILSIAAADARRAWAVGFGYTAAGAIDGRVIGTTNGGMSWDLLYHDQSGGYHANELAVVGTGEVWVAMDTSVIRTTDGGRAWQEAGYNSTAYATMGIAVPDGRHAWACSVNWNGGFLYYLPPGGATWIAQGLPAPVGGLSYVTFARQPNPAAEATLAIEVLPARGAWRLEGPPAGYTGPRVGTGSLAAARCPAGYYRVRFESLPGFWAPPAQALDLAAGQTGVLQGVYRSYQAGDFDGDGRSDPALYNGATGDWLVWLSDSAYAAVPFRLGGPGWTPVAADYDGDGRCDPCAAYTAAGLWRALLSGSAYGAIEWAVDLPGGRSVRGDFDGDARADPALYRAANGQWRVRLSSRGYETASFALGGANEAAVSGDFDGDGKADPCAVDAGSGLWRALLSGSGYTPVACVVRAPPGPGALWPVPADYDGDRRMDPAVFEPAAGAWTLLSSARGYASVTRFCGGPDSRAVPGDFDGDDRADPAVYRAGPGLWTALISGWEYGAVEAPLAAGPYGPAW